MSSTTSFVKQKTLWGEVISLLEDSRILLVVLNRLSPRDNVESDRFSPQTARLSPREDSGCLVHRSGASLIPTRLLWTSLFRFGRTTRCSLWPTTCTAYLRPAPRARTLSFSRPDPEVVAECRPVRSEARVGAQSTSAAPARVA
jgi:hypothetical protein